MFLITEIGSNWDGNMELAKDTIDECLRGGADMVKFQLWKTYIIYPDKPEFKKWEMSFDQAKELYKHAKGKCFFTPSYPEAVDFLEHELRVPLYKIASVTSAQKHEYSLEVMHKVADTGKPVIISYGYGDKTEDIFKDNHLFKLNCVSKYPAKKTDYYELFDDSWTYKMLLRCNISDHTKGTSLMCEILDKEPGSIIEKHVKLRDNSSPDSPFSLYTKELADFITLSRSSLFKLG